MAGLHRRTGDPPTPGTVAPVADERELLVSYLAQQRYQLKLAAYGLTDEQARLAPTASTLTIGGLIKHVATTERHWIRDIVLQETDGRSPDDYLANFRMSETETLADLIGLLDAVAADTESVVAAIPDLGQAVPVPHGVPWFPADVDAWSVRWVLQHLIAETARHTGHADIVRESIDGATAYPLMAAVEQWPPNDFLQPWEPAQRMPTR